jgi:hypothetical protein
MSSGPAWGFTCQQPLDVLNIVFCIWRATQDSAGDLIYLQSAEEMVSGEGREKKLPSRTQPKSGEKPTLSDTEAIRAYGTRVSAISANPYINPQGSDRQTLFASHIGTDSTSIWAAVTSSPGAIAIHLLACMLA